MSEFKVGDRVYSPTKSAKILTVRAADDEQYPVEVGAVAYTVDGRVYDNDFAPQIFRATPENHALLSQLYPNVEFEKPKLTGSDLTRQKLAEGAKEVLCWVSRLDSDASAMRWVRPKVIKYFDADLTIGGDIGWFVCADGDHWRYAVPVPRNYYAMDDE